MQLAPITHQDLNHDCHQPTAIIITLAQPPLRPQQHLRDGHETIITINGHQRNGKNIGSPSANDISNIIARQPSNIYATGDGTLNPSLSIFQNQIKI